MQLPHTVTLHNLDAKNIHMQIQNLEEVHRHMAPDDSFEAVTLTSTLKLLHQIEEELRQEARTMHAH